MLKGLFDFFSPEQTKQQQTKQLGQQKQSGQQTKQVSQQQQQQQQATDFVPQGKMQQLPPLKETSSLFQPKQSFQTSDQLAQEIIHQTDKQTQQSRQRLQQFKKDGLSQEKISQAEQAHQQILRNARQIKSLLADITETMQMNHLKQQQHNRIKQQQNNRVRQQTQQNKRVLKKMEKESEELITELRNVLEQMMFARQQSRRSQLAHIRQLQQVKTNLLQQQVMNKKTVQYDTPQGNKVRIQLSVKPDSKCCVAQSLAQKTRVHYRPRQQTVLV